MADSSGGNGGGAGLQITTSIEMFGHRFTVWQGERAVVLQVDDVYLLGDPDDDGNLVLPHALLIMNSFAAAQEICQMVDEHGATVALAAQHFARTHAADEGR